MARFASVRVFALALPLLAAPAAPAQEVAGVAAPEASGTGAETFSEDPAVAASCRLAFNQVIAEQTELIDRHMAPGASSLDSIVRFTQREREHMRTIRAEHERIEAVDRVFELESRLERYPESAHLEAKRAEAIRALEELGGTSEYRTMSRDLFYRLRDVIDAGYYAAEEAFRDEAAFGSDLMRSAIVRNGYVVGDREVHFDSDTEYVQVCDSVPASIHDTVNGYRLCTSRSLKGGERRIEFTDVRYDLPPEHETRRISDATPLQPVCLGWYYRNVGRPVAFFSPALHESSIAVLDHADRPVDGDAPGDDRTCPLCLLTGGTENAARVAE